MAVRQAIRRHFRLLNVLDDFNRDGLGIEVGFSSPAEQVVRSLNRITLMALQAPRHEGRHRPGPCQWPSDGVRRDQRASP